MQNPGVCFQEADLKAGEPKLDMLGLPRVMSGNFASVYELNCGDSRWAIRCFVRQVPGQQGRYARLSQYIQNVPLPYLVRFDYMLKGILVKGEWYPIVKMQWVEGAPLNTWVEENINNSDALLKLAQDWRAMMKDLSQHKVAHGDLQHGNVMVTPNNELRLVDYDGMYAPVFGRGRAPELGHINFQHPRRTADFYQEDLDNFSALVVYTSLRALAVDPDLWQKFYTVDNLVFVSADFKNPLNSPAFQRLKESKEPAVQQLTKLLEKCCLSPVENVPDFADIMTALDNGTLESLAMKTPAPAPTITFSRPAPEAATTGTRPAPAVAAATGSRAGTRSAYEGAPAVATQPLKSRQAPASTARPGYNMPPQEKTGGVPPWVWAVAGGLVVGVILLVVMNLSKKGSQPSNNENPPGDSGSISSEVQGDTASVDPVQPLPASPSAPTPAGALKVTALGTLKGHSGAVDVIAFSPDGKLLASGSSDKSVRVWDVQTGQPKRTISGINDSLVSLVFLSEGQTLCGVTGENTVFFWDAATGVVQRKVEDYKDNLFPVALSRDGNVLATGSATDRKTVLVVDPASGGGKASFANHSSWIKAVNFSPDGKLLVSVCHNESVNILDVANGKMVHTFTVAGNNVDFPPFNPDNRLLVTGSDGRNLKAWDVKSGSAAQTYAGHSADVKSCAFSPKGELLASGSLDGDIKIWDVATGAEKQTLQGHSAAINSLRFSPGGSLLVSGSADQTLRLWEVLR